MSMQFDVRRLMSELHENTHKVTVTNPNLDNIIANQLSPDQEEDGPYILDDNEWERFQQLADQFEEGSDWEKQEEPVDEMSTSSAAGAYNASLHATPKQYKGPEFKEDVNSGYKKVKGFRPGHTKLNIVEPKDLWNLNEREETEKFGFKIGDKVEVIDTFPDKAYGVITGFNEDNVILTLKSGGHSTFERPNFSINPSKVKIEKSEDKEDIKESYSKFKKETKNRDRSGQFHEAVKAVDKRLKEINKILEYTSQLREELFEDEAPEHSQRTKKVMERLTKSIAEAYTKIKKIK